MTYDHPSHQEDKSPFDLETLETPVSIVGSQKDFTGPDDIPGTTDRAENLSAQTEPAAAEPEAASEESPDQDMVGEPEIPAGLDSRILLEQINASLDSFHTRAEHYEETNRLLHSRVESLQSDQVRALLKPVFERLATLQAQAADAADAARDRDASSTSDFEFFAISIDELLALYDVEPVGAAAGTIFDSKLHHGARTVPTADEELDGRIQRVQRQGYKFAGAERVMLPARVSVYRYAAPAAPTASAAESDLPGSTA